MELATINAVFKGQEAFEYDVLNNYFWDMFIADAFIANGFDITETGDFYTTKKMMRLRLLLCLAALALCIRL